MFGVAEVMLSFHQILFSSFQISKKITFPASLEVSLGHVTNGSNMSLLSQSTVSSFPFL